MLVELLKCLPEAVLTLLVELLNCGTVELLNRGKEEKKEKKKGVLGSVSIVIRTSNKSLSSRFAQSDQSQIPCSTPARCSARETMLVVSTPAASWSPINSTRRLHSCSISLAIGR